mgnify:CR=1 FL=1
MFYRILRITANQIVHYKINKMEKENYNGYINEFKDNKI